MLIQLHELSNREVVSRGPLGKTSKAQWQGRRVAVVSIPKKLSEREEQNLLDHVASIRTIDHPNVLKLFGVVLGETQNALVMEFVAPRRLLHNLLHGPPEERAGFSIGEKFKIAYQVADAMAHLHELTIIHHDLSPHTVYVTSNGAVKINAFSFPLALDMTRPSAVRYLAACDAGRQSRGLDAFSFGILLWELFTEQTPFADLSNPFQVAMAVIQGQRPSLDHPNIYILGICGDKLMRLLHHCWNENADKRLRFTEIKEKLRMIARHEVALPHAIYRASVLENASSV
jgi:serine/threonine protein kinase